MKIPNSDIATLRIVRPVPTVPTGPKGKIRAIFAKDCAICARLFWATEEDTVCGHATPKGACPGELITVEKSTQLFVDSDGDIAVALGCPIPLTGIAEETIP